MPKYEVVTPWFGVKKGDVIETDTLNPIIAPNVRLLTGAVAELVVATPANELEPKAQAKK